MSSIPSNNAASPETIANAETPVLVVTGASGHLGRQVLAYLLDTWHVPAHRIVATTRKTTSLDDLAARGVVVREASYDVPESLPSAFAGAQRLLLISTDNLDVPERIRQHRAAIDAAVAAGVQHIVYTSMPRPEPGSLVPFARSHYESEQALKASGVGYTILRNLWYSELLLGMLPAAAASGQLYSAAGDGGASWVTRDDCARIAAASLVSSSSSASTKVTYDVTGPSAVTTADLARAASEISGKPVTVVDLTPEQLRAGLEAAGVNPHMAEVFTALDVNIKAGHVSHVSDAVERVTGRAPQSVRDFLKAHAAAFGV